MLGDLCGISYDQLEFELNNNASKRRFIGLENLSTLGPKAKTIWKYRTQLTSEGILNLFARFEECLAENGYMAGQIIDSALVENEIRRKRMDGDEETSEAEVESDTVIAYDGDEVVSSEPSQRKVDHWK